MLENGSFGNSRHLKLKLDFDNLKRHNCQNINLVAAGTVLPKIPDKTLDSELVFNCEVSNFDN